MRMRPTQIWSRTAAAVLAVAATTGVSACSSSQPAETMSTPTVSAKASASSHANGQHLEASDFSDAMKTPGTIVIDVRTPAEFAGGHLPGARNIDVASPDFAKQIDALDKLATYAVYCRSGKRSAAALEQMAAADFTHAYDLSGGITAWQDMGGPTTKGTS